MTEFYSIPPEGVHFQTPLVVSATPTLPPRYGVSLRFTQEDLDWCHYVLEKTFQQSLTSHVELAIYLIRSVMSCWDEGVPPCLKDRRNKDPIHPAPHWCDRDEGLYVLHLHRSIELPLVAQAHLARVFAQLGMDEDNSTAYDRGRTLWTFYLETLEKAQKNQAALWYWAPHKDEPLKPRRKRKGAPPPLDPALLMPWETLAIEEDQAGGGAPLTRLIDWGDQNAVLYEGPQLILRWEPS